MAYTDYRSPDVNVTVERVARTQSSGRTKFLPVFIGQGMTSRERVESFIRLKANTSAHPTVVLEYDAVGNIDLFKDTDFTLEALHVHKETTPGQPTTALVEGVDYEVVTTAALRQSSGTFRTTIKILDDTKAGKEDLYYDFDLRLENTDLDYVPRLLTRDQRYQAELFLGPKFLNENGIELRNDVAIAAELAFQLGNGEFYYLEVPREYGASPTATDFQRIVEELYFVRDAYRVVPLTYDRTVLKTVATFAQSVANPNDKRQVITFVATDPAEVTDKQDIDLWVEKAGGFSEELNSSRAYNIAGITQIQYPLDGRMTDLPLYFLAAAIAAFDASKGMAAPISTEVIRLFSNVKAPRFRTRVWNELARHGVFVVYKEDAPNSDGIYIHHQLSTAQSDAAEDQELSIVKNLDATTVRLRDWFKPYAGKTNIDADGLPVKLDATMAQAIDDIVNVEKFMASLNHVGLWRVSESVETGEGGIDKIERTLVTRLQGVPSSPANNLDIVLAI